MSNTYTLKSKVLKVMKLKIKTFYISIVDEKQNKMKIK